MNWISIDELRSINEFSNKVENLRWYGRENAIKSNICNNDYFIYKGRGFIGDKKVIYYETKEL